MTTTREIDCSDIIGKLFILHVKVLLSKITLIMYAPPKPTATTIVF